MNHYTSTKTTMGHNYNDSPDQGGSLRGETGVTLNTSATAWLGGTADVHRCTYGLRGGLEMVFIAFFGGEEVEWEGGWGGCVENRDEGIHNHRLGFSAPP